VLEPTKIIEVFAPMPTLTSCTFFVEAGIEVEWLQSTGASFTHGPKSDSRVLVTLPPGYKFIPRFESWDHIFLDGRGVPVLRVTIRETDKKAEYCQVLLFSSSEQKYFLEKRAFNDSHQLVGSESHPIMVHQYLNGDHNAKRGGYPLGTFDRYTLMCFVDTMDLAHVVAKQIRQVYSSDSDYNYHINREKEIHALHLPDGMHNLTRHQLGEVLNKYIGVEYESIPSRCQSLFISPLLE
jgi:hypothetical protein